MRVARHRRRGLGVAPLGERLGELEDRRVEGVEGVPEPEPQVRRDLVVARAAGVELARERADPLRQLPST